MVPKPQSPLLCASLYASADNWQLGLIATKIRFPHSRLVDLWLPLQQSQTQCAFLMMLEDQQVGPGDMERQPLTSDHMTLKAKYGCQIACICFGIPFILVEAGVNLSKCQLDLAFLAAWMPFRHESNCSFEFPK